MYIFKHAFLNLGRNKGRNILMAVILFAILFAAAVSIVVSSSTAQLIDRQKARFGAMVTLVRDNSKVPGGARALPTAEELARYADSDLLLKSQITASISGYLENLSAVVERGAEGNAAGQGYKLPNASLCASSRADVSDEFKSGLRKIVQGGFPEGGEQCIISKDLAEKNGLEVGDALTLEALGDGNMASQEAGDIIKLIISGIYEDNTQNSMPGSAMMNRRNEIYMNFSAFIRSEFYAKSNGIATAQFVLRDPADLDSFIKEMRGKGLPDYYSAAVDDAAYIKITKPLEGLKGITATLAIVVTVFGAAVLLILSILSMRERKYEVGVLRAIGLKKGRVSIGLLTEIALITVLCLSLSLGAASVFSQPIGDALLKTQKSGQSAPTQSNVNEQGDQILGIGGEMSTTVDESELPELEVRLDGKSAANIALIAMLLACCSSLAGVVFVTRYEPIKILSERN